MTDVLKVALALVMVLVVGPGVAAAQEPASPTALVRAAQAGAVVSILADGEPGVIRGTLLAADDHTVDVDVRGAHRRFDLALVSRIERDGDSLLNGTLIGMAVMGAWCARICGQGLDSAGRYPAAVAVGAALGGLIGAAIDAGRTGTTTVYRRPARLTVGAVLSPQRVAIVVRVNRRR